MRYVAARRERGLTTITSPGTRWPILGTWRHLDSCLSQATNTRSGLGLREIFSSWISDPVESEGQVLALKYHGYCGASERIRGEYQIVSMLTGLFWEVEHSAIYKPDPPLRRVVRSFAMQQRSKDVSDALKAFEEEFEALIHLKMPSS
jgi:hypothetical protein